MMSDRCFELYNKYLASESTSSKQNTYMLMKTLVTKCKQTIDQGFFNLGKNTFGTNDSDDDISPVKKDDAQIQTQMMQFTKIIIKYVLNELQTPNNEELYQR